MCAGSVRAGVRACVRVRACACVYVSMRVWIDMPVCGTAKCENYANCEKSTLTVKKAGPLNMKKY